MTAIHVSQFKLMELFQYSNLEDFIIHCDKPQSEWSPNNLRLHAEVEITFDMQHRVCRILVQPLSEIEEPTEPPKGDSWNYEEYTDKILITLLKRNQPYWEASDIADDYDRKDSVG